MIYLFAVIAGMVAAVVGWFITGVIAVWIAGLYGMSDFEGGRGMFAFLFVGPLGGLASMVLTVWLVVRIGKGAAPLGTSLMRVGIVYAAISAVVGAGILLRLYTVDTYGNEAPPWLELEMRLPASAHAPPRTAIEVELHTDKNVGTGQLFDEWSPSTDGYQTISGNVELARKTSSRILVVSLPDQPKRLFRLPLSRNPASTAAMSAWQHADHIDDPGEAQPRTAPADDPLEIRYRVNRAGDD
jgi:hypothetical protein